MLLHVNVSHLCHCQILPVRQDGALMVRKQRHPGAPLRLRLVQQLANHRLHVGQFGQDARELVGLQPGYDFGIHRAPVPLGVCGDLVV
jgi:hypothetical protein